MSNLVSTPNISAQLEQVLISGDLASLSPAERVSYASAVCKSLGLNPLTKPFEYIKLNGKLVLYAKRDAADQLRRLHEVSIKITAREVLNEVYVVTAQASTPDGRTDESTGAVAIGGLKGEALANAYLKCETKAKRRVTLSICGLGLLDETEVESVVATSAGLAPRQQSAARALAKTQAPAQDPTPAWNEDWGRPAEGDVPPEQVDFLTEAARGPSSPEQEIFHYVVPVGKKHKGKRLMDIPVDEIQSFVAWIDAQDRPSSALLETSEKMKQYLEMVPPF